MYQSTITSWALMLSKAIEHEGHNSEHIFEKAGLDIVNLRDPNARYSYQGMTKLWSLAATETGDECIGIKAARFWHPTSLHALGYSWMASNNLQEALERLVRYSRIVSTVGDMGLSLKGEEVTLGLMIKNHPQPAIEAMDAALSVLVHMCRTSYGDELNIVQVNMMRNKPGCYREFEAFFRAPLVFNSKQDSITFNASELASPLPTSNSELVRVNDQIITEHLAELEKSDIVSRVKREIIRLLPLGTFSEDIIAHKLHTSLRSLQRKLMAEGKSYKGLQDETRRELAMQYIRDSRHSINEITYLLGFTEPSNFSRAFKRWAGVSPSQFRQSLKS